MSEQPQNFLSCSEGENISVSSAQDPQSSFNSPQEPPEVLLEKPVGLVDGMTIIAQEQVSVDLAIGNEHDTEIVMTPEASTPLGVLPEVSAEVLLPSEVPVPITKLPMEVIEKVFTVFIENKCPLLCSLYRTGCLPINSEQGGLHTNSSYIEEKLKKEQTSLLPLLRLSSYFYGVISGILCRHNAYITGVRSFECLDLFSRRRAAGSFSLPRSPVIESYFRKEGEPCDPRLLRIHGSPAGILPFRDSFPMTEGLSFDPDGRGTEWRESRQQEQSWKPKGWEEFPVWLIGGSRPSGEYLFENVEDGEETCDYPAFMAQLESLVIGPDLDTWHIDHPPKFCGAGNRRTPDINFTAPSRHLMFKVFDPLCKRSKLEKLIISGNILRNASWLAPKALGEFHPLSRLTHLTLSLSENPSRHDSPLRRLQKYIETPLDCHICNLLTGRNGDDGSTTPVPFLKTLKHLHLRGPGAHVCENMFNADWKALDNVVVEMGTHRGICDGEIIKLLRAVDNAAHNRLDMAIEITVRMCQPQHETLIFGHHWWRTYPEVTTIVKTAAEATCAGEILTLVKKLPGPDSPVYPAPRKLVELETLIENEMGQVLHAVDHILVIDGIDALTMTYMDNPDWRNPELEMMQEPPADFATPICVRGDRIEELRVRADNDWLKSAEEPLYPRYFLDD